MGPAFLNKVNSVAMLGHDDTLLLETQLGDVRHFIGREDIVSDGEEVRHIVLMKTGWSCRYKVLKNGARQITAFLLPGDFCDAYVAMLKSMDHGIAALGPAQVAFVSGSGMERLLARPAILRALLFAGLVDESVLRAWIVNVGRRSAVGRIANLFCELYARLSNVGLTVDGSFQCPLTQEDLGDALGLTSVHVNRSLRQLRTSELMDFKRGFANIQDLAALQRVAGFDPSYLHLCG